MCGINGLIFKNSSVDEKKILSMNELISHRGPDQSGYIKHNNLLLGHTRLSILDTSKKGFQPMTADGRFWIIYNGEVYNYKEIKKELINKNYKFFSETDTEVVLNAYKEWGVESFNKFNGEWALAILDKFEETLIICRDGIGYKPCYIFEDNNYLAFSSEIKSFSSIKTLEFNNANLGIHSTTLQSTCKTFYKNIEILRHGRVLKINLKNYNKKIERWDYPLKQLPKINSGYKENVNDFYSLLYQSTKLRLNSDVKVGTSLSGGLDSSAIFALLNSIEKNDVDLELSIYCTDIKSFNELENKGYKAINIISELESSNNKLEWEAGNEDFGLIMIKKFEAIYNSLTENKLVLYIDGDVVIKKDITDYLCNKIGANDFLFQLDYNPKKTEQNDLCAGFMMIKSHC